MRLFNIKTFQLETLHSDVPEYAALSHTWANEAVTFQDLTAGTGRQKRGWNKVLWTTIEVVDYKCDYVWIDTCCIDKSSSAELSEVINSMFRWHRKSKVCFSYLEDVRCEDSRLKPIETGSDFGAVAPAPHHHCQFSDSHWFTRGWTVQKLIAPKRVCFYDSSWCKIGEKDELEDQISRRTGIDSDVLHDSAKVFTKSIARRMSWASRRETTKTEDIAYCLMEIFDVNMPLLFGEGVSMFPPKRDDYAVKL